MIRFFLRFLGVWILAAGFVFVVYDGTKSIADKSFYYTTVENVWAWVHQDSLQGLRPAIEPYAGFLWSPIMVTLLGSPASLALGVLGAVMVLLGRRKKPLIGYARS